MVKRRAALPDLVDERLVRQMSAAARATRRCRGWARMRAMARYVAALQLFTDRAIASLEGRARR